jgi:hypothetical protein
VKDFNRLKETTRLVWDKDARDEKILEGIGETISRLNPNPTTKKNLLLCWGVNSSIWLVTIVFPNFIYDTYQLISVSDYGKAIILIPFGCAAYGAYLLLRSRFPDIENTKFDSDIMSSYGYQVNSVKRWKVWVASCAVGAVNTILLMLVDAYLANAY